jgi:hypothetical protein
VRLAFDSDFGFLLRGRLRGGDWLSSRLRRRLGSDWRELIAVGRHQI